MVCEHYTSNCLVRFGCCQSFHSCRLCHDKAEKHKANRYEIDQMLCTFCNTLQAKSKFCSGCFKAMSKYFCSRCNLWDDPREGIFHCEKCNVCRRGDAEAVFHCDICQTCLISMGSKDHVHVENTTGGNCPICAENMSESTTTLVLLVCGHSLHEACFKDFIKETYTCPICLKSTGDTSRMNKKIEQLLGMGLEPSGEKISIDSIRCHDCNSISEQKSRTIYNKCSSCNSYNTRVTEHKG